MKTKFLGSILSTNAFVFRKFDWNKSKTLSHQEVEHEFWEAKNRNTYVPFFNAICKF